MKRGSDADLDAIVTGRRLSDRAVLRTELINDEPSLLPEGSAVNIAARGPRDYPL